MSGAHISLFAGAGMADLAVEAAGFKTVATAEVDPFCRSILAKRLPDASHLDDVRKVNRASGIQHRISRPLLVSGGFPCQDVSPSGTGLGLSGARSGLWSEFLRVIREFQPRYVLGENSAMLRHRGLPQILYDLWLLDYNVQWETIPAAAVGAPHLRDRVWIGAVRRGYAFAPPHGAERLIGWAARGGVFTSTESGEQITRLPRAGCMIAGAGTVFERAPRFTIKAARAALKDHTCLCPATPTGGWPTPAASNPQDGESAESWLDRREVLKLKGINGNGAGMPLSVAVQMFPTPTKSDGTGGPGTTPKRAGGKNLRTVIAESEGNGRVNPEWAEWMMGLPRGWTDPTIPNRLLMPHGGWATEHSIPRTAPKNLPNRAKRMQVIGNGLVPQVAAVALDDLLNWR